MTKSEAQQYMIEQIEKIEKECIADNLATEKSTKKKDIVAMIINTLQEVDIDEN